MFAPTDIFMFMLILTRMVGLLLFVPFFSHHAIPVIAKGGFSAAFALIVFPLVDFTVEMLFFMIDFASHVLTVEIGLTPGAEFDPSSSRGGNPMGSMMYFLGLMVVLSGSEYDILRAYVSSYQIAPVGFTIVNEYAGDFVIEQSAGIFKIGILMAAPVIAVNFLVNLVFAVLGKVVPKLNVFILSFSARILAGISIFSFSILMVVGYIMNYTNGVSEMMMRFILFRPAF